MSKYPLHLDGSGSSLNESDADSTHFELLLWRLIDTFNDRNEHEDGKFSASAHQTSR